MLSAAVGPTQTHASVELRPKRSKQRWITHFSKCSAPLVDQASPLLFELQLQCHDDNLASVSLNQCSRPIRKISSHSRFRGKSEYETKDRFCFAAGSGSGTS
jgi:hypothetical protein